MIYIDKTVKSRKLVLLDKMAYPVKTLLLDEMNPTGVKCLIR